MTASERAMAPEEWTENARLRAENARLRKQLRREQTIASALANISHVIDENQSGPDVIHAEDCPACAASHRIADALAAASDEQQRPHDSEGRPLCFVCRRPQSAHEGGVECEEDHA